MTTLLGTYGTMYYVRDMKKAVAFYKEQFSLTPTFESDDWSEFNLNGHALCLHGVKENEKVPENGFLIAKVNGIHDVVQQLKISGVEFEGEIKEVTPGAFCVAFRDVSGNRVDLYEDTNQP